MATNNCSSCNCYTSCSVKIIAHAKQHPLSPPSLSSSTPPCLLRIRLWITRALITRGPSLRKTRSYHSAFSSSSEMLDTTYCLRHPTVVLTRNSHIITSGLQSATLHPRIRIWLLRSTVIKWRTQTLEKVYWQKSQEMKYV